MVINRLLYRALAAFIIILLLSSKIYAANYYWVGGTGNWNDLSKWKTTSGGTTSYAAVPGAADHVFFDANSGFTSASRTITVNIPALCANFTVSGVAAGSVPSFVQGAGASLAVYGNMQLQSGGVFSAVLNFKPLAAQTLNTGGITIANNVTIDGPGTLTMQANTRIADANTLTFVNGTFETNNFRLDVGGLRSSGTAAKMLRLGSSQVYIAVGAIFHTANITIDAGTSHLYFTKSMHTTFPFSTTNLDGLSANQAITLYNATFTSATSGQAGINHQNTATGSFTFNNLTFNGNASLNVGSHIVANLFLASGKYLMLPGGETLTVTQSLNLGASTDACGQYNTLSSIVPGTVANIRMMPGAIANVYHSNIRDINIFRQGVPTDTFDAQLASVNAGGNTGWNFVAATPTTYYWVGGAGNWQDPTRWSITSGGAAGTCIPSAIDHAIFDNNSGFTAAGQAVTVSTGNSINNVSFLGTSNAPTLTGSTLSIAGSAIWQAGMLISSSINYATRGLQTVTSNGVKHNLVTIAGYNLTTDKLTLADDFETISNIYFTGGTFNTNNRKLTLLNFYSDATQLINSNSDLLRRLELTASEVVVNGDDFSVNDVVTQLQIAGGTSLIRFTKQLSSGDGLNAAAGQQYYNVIFEHPLSATGSGIARSGPSTTFNNVTFIGDGSIRYGATINNLTFSPGKTYLLGNQGVGNRAMVNVSLNAVSTNCNTPITINSWGGTNDVSTLQMPASATVNVDYAVIGNISATGGANFTALNSTDLEGNTGWTFPTNASRTLYWIGGSGNWSDSANWSLTSGGPSGECVPDTNDDVFFDVNSGFTAADKTVTLNSPQSYVRNLTIAGTVAAPTIVTSGANVLNVYGSMTLQAGGAYTASTAFKPLIGTVAVLTTNGVTMTRLVRLEGTGTLMLGGNTIITDQFNINRGTFDTDGKNLTVDQFFDWYSSTAVSRIINLRSSTVTVTSGSGSAFSFLFVLPSTVLNAGTSTINFTGSFFSSAGLSVRDGVALHNVIFSNPSSTSAGIGRGFASYNDQGDNLTFNSLTFKGSGAINTTGNTFGTLVLSAGKTYSFLAGATQTVTGQLYASGNSCGTLAIRSLTSGSQTNINVNGGTTNFDYAVLTDINATGNTLTFGVNSSNGGNNTNVVFDTSGTVGTIVGLGADWSCHIINPTVPSTYNLNTNGFYADPNTTYSWTKVGDPLYPGVLGTASTLDISTTGYGTYRVVVTYDGGCVVNDQILVQRGTEVPIAAANQKFCATVHTSIANIAITGTAVKWYADATSTTVLPTSTLLVNGVTYYATQTIHNSCESARVPVTVILENCAIANPALRSRGIK